MEPGWADVDVVLRRLQGLLPERLGPHGARSVLDSLLALRERGGRPLDVLHAAQASLDAFVDREPLAAPFPIAVCRGIADAGAHKLAALSSRIGFHQPVRGLTTAELEGLADHATALVPAFHDVELCIGAAWKNALLYRLSLVVGECWNRNDGAPLFDLAAAAADLRLGPDVVPLGLVRHQGVVVARGAVDAHGQSAFRPRSFSYLRFTGDPIVVDVDGGFVGAKRLLALWALPITAATLPWIVHVLSMPFPVDAVVVDPDQVIGENVSAEDVLEQERFVGPLGDQVRARLGVTRRTFARDVVRFQIDGTTLTYRSGGALDVD